MFFTKIIIKNTGVSNKDININYLMPRSTASITFSLMYTLKSILQGD